MTMTCHDQDTFEDLKHPINVGADVDTICTDILADMKGHILVDIKVESNVLDETDVQKPDIVKLDTRKDIRDIQAENFIKDEPGVCTSVTTTFEPNRQFTELDVKYTKAEQSMLMDDLICDNAGPSSSYKLKCEEVDFGVMKMDEEEDSKSKLSEMEDWKSRGQYPAEKEAEFICQHYGYVCGSKECFAKHTEVDGEKIEIPFHCVKCEMQFPEKLLLDSHIVSLHSDNGEMMKSVRDEIFHCKHCTYITVRKSDLTIHMRKHGEIVGTTFNCIKCEKEFLKKKYLDGHILASHSDNGEMMKTVTHKIRRCKYCEYITVDTSNLSRHVGTHGEKLEKL